MSNKIEVLPESVSQIIAAGEVVERPASVVKELLENAIDAGSTDITLELKAGGLQLIRVVDNGEGMAHEDVPVAFQRYATSKIRKSEDLYAIHTLGFRGEALPSIAQVSQVILQSRTPHSLSGTEVIFEGGILKRISEFGCPVGTEVVVKNIFFNVPVKRKFLKSIRAEFRYALQQFLRLSLSHPGISFKMIHDDRTLHDHPKTNSPLVRIETIFGKEIYRHLQPVEYEEKEVQISGFASVPSFSKKNTDGIFFYVNQRFVKDRIIYKAIMEGYRHFLPGHEFPIVILFLSLPPSTVDMNVHPTKAEVKFKETEKIYQAVLAAIQLGLKREGPGWKERLPAKEGEETFFQKEGQPISPFQETLSLTSPLSRGKEEDVFLVQEGEREPWPNKKRSPYVVLDQIQGTYLLCEGEGNLIFIDQHAGHERILFEKFKEDRKNRLMISERLLLPILIELSAEESYLLESSREAWEAIGFEIESVGEKLFAIRSIPSWIKQKDPKEMVRGILDELSFIEKEGKGDEAIQAILISLACHSAVRANVALKREEMDQLAENLIPFYPSTTCPHGRPIFFILPLETLKKQFKRK